MVDNWQFSGTMLGTFNQTGTKVDKDTVLKTIKDYEDLEKHAHQIALEYAAIAGVAEPYEDFEDLSAVWIDSDEEYVTITWDEFNCGKAHEESISFPIELLWAEDWQEPLREKLQRDREARAFEWRQAKKSADLAALQIKYSQYQELKSRFDGVEYSDLSDMIE